MRPATTPIRPTPTGATRGRRRRDGRTGAAALEFAMLVPMLTLLLMGMFDYGKHLYISVMATEAVRQGARALARTSVGTCGSTAASTAQTTAQSAAGPAKTYMNQIGLGGSPTTITATCSVSGGILTWTVALQTDYPPYLGFLTAKNLMKKGTGTNARVNATLSMRGQ